jgi:L-asparaginase
MKAIALISTGGTIEKTYDALSGALKNEVSVLDVMLASLELRGVSLERLRLMNKDSLEMSAEDHTLIAETAVALARKKDGVVIVHGTDRLAVTGDRIAGFGRPPVPIVLTGAMRPYELRTTDALQNLIEALLAVQLCPPGVYVAMHNTVLAFPGVVKDRELGTFTKPEYAPAMARKSQQFKYQQERTDSKRAQEAKTKARKERLAKTAAVAAPVKKKPAKAVTKAKVTTTESEHNKHAARKASYALEDSAGAPSRKSTRKASNHQKTDSQLKQRATRASTSPSARARHR